MSTPSFTARLQSAGAALRQARPSGNVPRRAGPMPPRRLGFFVVVGILGLLAIVYLTLRLTPLSTVQRVTVVGAQGPDADQIRKEIEKASLGQSTLGFGEGAVQRAVAGTTSITGLTIHTNFPHAVQVEVHQRLAIGAVQDGGKRVAVATDGKLLPDWEVGKLPLIRGARTENGSVTGGGLLAAAVLAKAPPELLAHVARVDGGTTVRLANGPALLFRDTDRVVAKWAAVVAVLSDPGTAGATWIDLRVPDQPVAGKGAPPTLPSRTATVGRLTSSTDALATAEDRTPDSTSTVAGTAAATQATSTGSTSAASAPVAATTSASPSATPAATTATTPSSGGTGVAGTTGSTTGSSGSTATGASGTTNSGAVSAGTGASGTSGGASTSGGGTAPTSQTTP